MPISRTDSKQLIRAHLLADATINTLTAGQVYGSHISSADAQTALRPDPIVVFEFVGGAGRYFRELETPVVELYTYSKASGEQAAQLYDLVYVRLQGERLQIAGIGPCGIARELGRPLDGFVEELGAWYQRSRWVLTIIAGPE